MAKVRQIIVYETTNSVNGIYYVGKHKIKDIGKDSYLGSGVALKHAIMKYGTDNFFRETLKSFKTHEEAYDFEKSIVNQDFIENKNTYNICGGGYGASIISKETRMKISIANKGTKHSDETKKKWSLIRKGTRLSDDHKEKLSIIHKGRTFSVEHREKLSIVKKGIKFSPEHKKKLSIAKRGKKRSKETKMKISIASKGIRKPQETIICPWCHLSGGTSAMRRWHFDNCKFRTGELKHG